MCVGRYAAEDQADAKCLLCRIPSITYSRGMPVYEFVLQAFRADSATATSALHTCLHTSYP